MCENQISPKKKNLIEIQSQVPLLSTDWRDPQIRSLDYDPAYPALGIIAQILYGKSIDIFMEQISE